jgi:hypothetical protein
MRPRARGDSAGGRQDRRVRICRVGAAGSAAAADAEFARIVERIHKLGLPAISGYGFMPADVMIVGPSVDWAKVDEALRHGIGRAKQLGLSMVVYGNLLNRARRAPEGFSIAEARKQLQEFGKTRRA